MIAFVVHVYRYMGTLASLALLVSYLPAVLTSVILTFIAVRSGPYPSFGVHQINQNLPPAILGTTVGLGLWLLHWGSIQRSVARPDEPGNWERRSPVRFTFFVVVFFLGALMTVNYGRLAVEGWLGFRSGRLVVADLLTGELIGPLCDSVFFIALTLYHVTCVYRDRHPVFGPKASPGVPYFGASAAPDPLSSRRIVIAGNIRLWLRCAVVSGLILPILLPLTLFLGGRAISVGVLAVVAPVHLVSDRPEVVAELVSWALPLLIVCVAWWLLTRMLRGETALVEPVGEARKWWWIHVYLIAAVALAFAAGSTTLGVVRVLPLVVGGSALPASGPEGRVAAQWAAWALGVGITGLVVWLLHWRLTTPLGSIPLTARTLRRVYLLVLSVGSAVGLARNTIALLIAIGAGLENVPPGLALSSGLVLVTLALVFGPHVLLLIREARPDDWDQRLLHGIGHLRT